MDVDVAGMDQAAVEAIDELKDMMQKDPKLAAAVMVLAQWWVRHYMKAGHKRLARGLMKFAKE